MPLVRYEIKNEHSLANPQLYRSAAKDDPEGLLEGVAMAGLVGIVRQLGDLAEFAAEVFRDLHEEVMATASRGHELLARVQQLEAEIPAVEKALLSETNQLRFAYTPGAEWHASLRNDQNHCTQGDLPRFIRNSYEECRGPPRLFLLDKFDVAGAGACLKRYTDPSFFRTEWASSELMKAERVQRDKRARREKKGRRRRNGDAKESIPVEQLHTRFSHEFSKELGQSDQLHPRMWHLPVAEKSEGVASVLENTNYNPTHGSISRKSPETSVVSQGVSRQLPDASVVTQGASRQSPKASVLSQSVSKQSPEASVLSQRISGQSPRASVSSQGTSRQSPEDSVFSVGVSRQSLEASVHSQGVPRQLPEASVLSQGVSRQSPETPDDRQGVSRRSPEARGLSKYSPDARGISEAPIDSHVDLSAVPEIIQPSQTEPLKNERAYNTEEGVISGKGQELGSIAPTNDERFSEKQQRVTVEIEDVASESEQFLDALATMEFEVDSDSEPRSRQETGANAERISERKEESPNLKSSDAHHFATNDKGAVPKAENSETSMLSNSGGHPSHGSSTVSNSQDVKITSSTVRRVHPRPLHVRRHSTESISFPSPKDAAKNNHLLDEPHVYPRGLTKSGPSSFLKNEKEASTLLKIGVPSSFNTGVKVSKMVAAFEKGSLEQIHHEGPQKEPRNISTVPTISEPAAQSTIEASVKVGAIGGADDNSFDHDSRHDSSIPFTVSPATKDSSPQLHGSPHRLRIRVEETSFSGRISVGSLGSPPESPGYSALLSPISPIRTGRNILSSPDSQRMGFSTDLLYPDSSSYVPVLALSPTSRTTPPPLIHPSEDLELQMFEETLSVVSPSTSSVELDTALPAARLPGTASQSPIALEVTVHDSSASVPRRSDDVVSPSPRRLDLQNSIQPALTFDSDLSTSGQSDNIEALDATLFTVDIADHNSIAERAPSSPEMHSYSSLGSPRQPLDENVTSCRINDVGPAHAAVKAGIRTLEEPVSLQTPPPVASLHGSTSSLNSNGEQQPLSPQFRLVESPAPHSVPSHDLLPWSAAKAAHELPFSLSPSGDTQDLASAQSSRSRQDLPALAIPSKTPQGAIVSPSDFREDPPSLSPPSRTFHDLPPPTPPSRSQRDFQPPHPPPSRTIHELPTQRPLLQTPPPPRPVNEVSRLTPSGEIQSLAGDVQDSLLGAITSHDRSMLKKVKTMQNPSLRKGDDRSHLLEQIRAQSFNLRHTVLEKPEPPVARPVTNINVAAILEKANAIRQAFAGSDEDEDDDDDWSDV